MTTGGGNFWTSGAVPLIEPEFLSSIISAASDIALVVSATGLVLSVVQSQNDDSFGNLKHWESRHIGEFLTDESVVKFNAAHKDYLAGINQAKPLELNHSDNAVWQYPVRYTFHRFGKDDAVLMLGRDLRPIAETQQQLVQAQIALEQGYEARREFDARYRVMLARIDEAVLFLSVQNGRIEDANESAADLLGLKVESLIGTSFATLFSDMSGGELVESLINSSLSEESEPLALRSVRNRKTIKITPYLFRAGGQRMLMCRLRDDATAPMVRSGVETSAAALFRATGDAIVFIDIKGKILSVNDSFLDMVGAAHRSEAVGRGLADFLGRGQIDLGVLLGHPDRSAQMRIYATKLVNALGSKMSVEISATLIDDAEHPAVGLIIRDLSRLEPLRKSAGGPTPMLADSTGNVMDLVGSASLKEIVAETTDVVEKICIETAVKITDNNRVAAAEMLGLSRQSLYVKLRKYGLLNKDG